METFTVEELAKYLKLHEYTIRRLARSGKIPSFKAGGQWRFRRDEIDQWSRGRATKITETLGAENESS